MNCKVRLGGPSKRQGHRAPTPSDGYRLGREERQHTKAKGQKHSVLASASLLRDPTVWPTTLKTLSDVVRKLYEFRKDT